MPARPNPPVEPDETSAAVCEALGHVRRASDSLRDAYNAFDEASEVPNLPPDLAATFTTWDSVLSALRQNIEARISSLDDKAELLYSRHSPLQRDAGASDDR